MVLYTIGHSFDYKIDTVIRIFYPDIKVETKEEYTGAPLEDYILTKVEKTAHNHIFTVKASVGGKESSDTLEESTMLDKDIQWKLSRMVYKALWEITGKSYSWGVLTGVRPARLWRSLEEKGKSQQEIRDIFEKDFLVSKEKIELLQRTVAVQKPLIQDFSGNSFSLYISIPFCPTRCLYCSFVSHAIENTHKLVPEFVRMLVKELAYIGKLVKDIGLTLRSVYIGGGTPTQLNHIQLGSVLKAVRDNFDLANLKEFTVEAGRPDTINRDKLAVMQEFGVDRISINPQTLNQNVLDIIGRAHTVEDFYNSFQLAREYDFKVINTDLILGLPSESESGFMKGLDRIVEMKPENITIHTLTVKRSASYRNLDSAYDDLNMDLGNLLEESQKKLLSSGYNPYYLYRQKGTKENMENTGFSFSDKESYYNIGMMEDIHTVIGAGGGATTKIVRQDSKIERIYNFKFPYEYIDRFSEILKKKDVIRRYYETFKQH